MIKLRKARYCNLKLLLIFLVIYGHMIETRIWQNTVLMTQYKFIYLVHMPLFSFLSGLFITDCRSCTVQLKRLLPIYIVLQTAAFLIKNGTLKLITPYWHLWYLHQLCLLDWNYMVVVLFCKRQRKYYNTYVGVIHWVYCRIYKYHRS